MVEDVEYVAVNCEILLVYKLGWWGELVEGFVGFAVE